MRLSASLAANLLGIAIGAVLGAWARWGLGLWLNRGASWLPLGTLVANLVGGLCIGLLLAWADQRTLDTWWRMVLITGFLGALTTFSTFSAESLQLLLKKEYVLFLGHSAAHLVGAIAATAAAYALGVHVFARHGNPLA
jgi:fluoride exporter